MSTAVSKLQTAEIGGRREGLAWLPVVLLPALGGMMLADRPAWVQMWGLAAGLFCGLKWLSWSDYAAGQALGYCQHNNGATCKLYAVDDQVVWTN